MIEMGTHIRPRIATPRARSGLLYCVVTILVGMVLLGGTAVMAIA